MPDPDTGSLRQIDGVIRRDGKIVHIECRDHSVPQDVMWIEELIGRRESLEADGVIAVSLSGFGKPALTKAKAKGIVTRTLSEMTDTEIESWGRSVNLAMIYFEISELKLQLIVPYAQWDLVTNRPKLWLSGSRISPEFLILQDLIRRADDSLHFDRGTAITAEMQIPALMVDGASVTKFSVLAKGRKRRENQKVLGLWNYHGFDPVPDTKTVVSKHGPGLTEIIQENECATLMLDMSSINTPKNCFPIGPQIDFGRVVKARIDTVGSPIRMDMTLDMTIDVEAEFS